MQDKTAAVRPTFANDGVHLLRTGVGSAPSLRRQRSETTKISTEACFTQAWL